MAITEEARVLRSDYLVNHKSEFLYKTFCGIFHETACQYPDKMAVLCSDCALTYRELDEYSNGFAKKIAEQGFGSEDIIAIESDRSVRTIVAMLGILKAGAAYLFLEEYYPRAGKQVAYDECECRIVLKKDDLLAMDLVRDPEFVDRSAMDSLAILVYTSGSTASPKGVMLENRNLAAVISNFDRFGFCETDRTCVFASFSFVASVFDIFASLIVGAEICIIPEERRWKMELITEFYKLHHITVSFLPPHMAMKFMEYDEDEFDVRLLLVGSEPARNLKPKKYKILNVYAASELCSLISCYEITTTEKSYPIGTLNPTVEGYIVDEEGRLVADGEAGELWLAGPQVARGYMKRRVQTKAQFDRNPFSDCPGYARIYKTRDIVKRLPGGNLVFITRKDNMFKVRGFRIESGAVESAVLRCSAIKEVVVKAFEDSGGCNILCGYFVSDEAIDTKGLKKELKKILPYYMIPTCFIQLDEFPRNRNNKIDRGAIRAPKELDDHKLLEELY